MLKVLKKFFEDSSIYKMKHFLVDEVDHLNKMIINKPYNSEELIRKRDEINHALFGV
jgi:hypothetical protein